MSTQDLEIVRQWKGRIGFQFLSLRLGSIGRSRIGKVEVAVDDVELSVRRGYFQVFGQANASILELLASRTTHHARTAWFGLQVKHLAGVHATDNLDANNIVCCSFGFARLLDRCS